MTLKDMFLRMVKKPKQVEDQEAFTIVYNPFRNPQPAEKPDYDPRGCVEIVGIWHTIQGEGPYAGRPAIFIRVAGCNLDCPGCDTDYTSMRVKMTPPQIVQQCLIMKLPKKSLVVITGGEPFRQDISSLCNLLLHSFDVQVETNGTLMMPRQVSPKVNIVCSPKSPTITPRLRVDAYKYILDAKHVDPDDGLPTSVLGNNLKPARPKEGDEDKPIYVQPMDAQDENENTANLEAAIQSCLRFNYTLCLQIQKIIGMP